MCAELQIIGADCWSKLLRYIPEITLPLLDVNNVV